MVRGVKAKLLEQEINDLLDKQIIQKSSSPWCAPAFIVNANCEGTGTKKPRMVIDYRKLNQHVIKDPIRQNTIDDVIHEVGTSRSISSFDMTSGYLQVPLDPETADRSAFLTVHGKWEYRRVPFGLSTSQSAFLRCLEAVLPEKAAHKITNYIDDIFVGGDTFEEHLANLRYLFSQIKAAGMTLKLSKASFLKEITKILGHEISSHGTKPQYENVRAVADYHTPSNVKQIRSFLGLCSFYRKFIPNFSNIAEPLNNLTRKNQHWNWTPVQQQAFDTLKTLLTHAPVLAAPHPTGEFELTVDASNIALGAVLSQTTNGVKRPVAYASRGLSKSERNYSVSCREALAICWAVNKFRPYLENKHFVIASDHKSLLSLQGTNDPTGKLARYALFLSSFDFKIKYIKGRNNQPADALSRIHQTAAKHRDEQPHMASAPLDDPNPLCALIKAKRKQRHLSTAAVKTLTTITNEPEVPLREYLMPEISSHNEPQCLALQPDNEDNKKDTSDNINPSVKDAITEGELFLTQRNDPALKPIIEYLETGTIPTENRRKFKQKWRSYRLEKGILVKHDKGRQRTVIPQSLKPVVISFMHNNRISGHFGIARTVEKIRRTYFWPKMFKDVERYVKACDICQRYKYSQKPLQGKMLTRETPRAVWEVCYTDVYGPLPRTNKGNAYVVIFMDAYSKAVELIPIEHANALTIAKCFVDYVYCRHGAPIKLTSDNAAIYVGKILQHVCSILGVEKCHILPYHAQSNPCERALKDVGRMVASYTHDFTHNKWDIGIQQLAFAINSSFQFSSKFPPFFLMHGRHPRLPAVDDTHMQTQVNTNVDDYITHLHTTLTNTREIVTHNLKQATDTQKRAYDTKRREATKFSCGELVLIDTHYLSNANNQFSAKLAPKRTGPYRITHKDSNVAFRLIDENTNKIIRAHISQMTPYFSDHTNTNVSALQGQGSSWNTSTQELTDDSDDEDHPRCCMPGCTETQETDFVFCDLCDRAFHVASCVGVTLDIAKAMDFLCVLCRSEAKH